MENSSNHRFNLLLLTYLICSALFSTVLFISSFFPITYHSNVAANFDNIPTEINGVNLNSTKHYKPSADKVVFMVIDALRWDFVNETYRRSMPYTTKAIRRNSACLMQAKANAPTVTMPRIKAMMTGMVSDFIDVVLNLGTHTVSSDSLLNQARLAGHKIIFYGDDTWIKLFPKIFHRYEGTTSFFVSDFTEVDQNVTRNINKELEKREDWSIMILHYLGLDHIGHVEGPNSPLIGPKLTEMDAVIGTILNRIERWRKKGTEALLIVCGDHGMKNSGGHGGATEEETLVPFIVFGKSCSPGVSQIEQIDVASTLAVLLGIPIPHSNVGSVAIQMIKDQSKTSQLFLLHYNAKQMFQHFKKLSQYEASDIYDDYYKAIKLHTKWLLGRNKPGNDGRFSYIASLYDRTLKNMKAILVKSAVKYEKSTLTFATILLIQVSIIFFNKHWDEPFVFNFFAYCWSLGMILWLILNHVFHNRVNEIYFDISDYLVMTMAFIIYTINSGFCAKSPDFQLPELKFVQLFFPMAIILHAISFVSSSFVEEEHQTWYFIWTTFLVIVLYYAAGRLLLQTEAPGCFMELGMILVLLLQHRILTHWNTTGNKYAHLPDIGDWLRGHETVLSVILIFSLTSLIIIGYICEDERRIRRFSLLFHIVLATFVYTKHTLDKSQFIFNSLHSASKGIHEVHIFWLLLGLFLLYSTVENYCIYHNDRKKFFRSILYDVIRIWVAISALLHRSHNVVLVPMELITLLWMYKLTKRYNCNPVYIAYWIGNMFYFYQGNSNSLATIDVTAAYVGLHEFWPIVGTIYVCINTYSAPILAYFVIVYRIMSDNLGIDGRVNIFSINKDMALLRIFPLAVYTLIVTVHRYHLFIWSVFSPKLLYEGMYTAVLLIIIVHVQIPFTLDV